jgi:hypothetical protein
MNMSRAREIATHPALIGRISRACDRRMGQ